MLILSQILFTTVLSSSSVSGSAQFFVSGWGILSRRRAAMTAGVAMMAGGSPGETQSRPETPTATIAPTRPSVEQRPMAELLMWVGNSSHV